MRRRKRGWILLLAALLLVVNGPAVCAMESGEDREDEDVTLAPYFFIEGADPAVDHLPLKATEVKAVIDGIIADTYVTQTYANQGKHAINASYVFPASTRVSVHGMTMQVGDQILRAQIKEKEEAKAEVTALGLQYHMATPYTSFVAVLDTVRNPEGDSTDVDQPSALPRGVSELSIGGYRRGAEPGDWLLAAAAAAAVLLGLRRKKRAAW